MEEEEGHISVKRAFPLKSYKGHIGGEVEVALFCFSDRIVVSVAGVHSELSETNGAVNKSEVYSHYLGLLFYCILSQLLSGPTKQRQRQKKQGCNKKEKKSCVAHRV